MGRGCCGRGRVFILEGHGTVRERGRAIGVDYEGGGGDYSAGCAEGARGEVSGVGGADADQSGVRSYGPGPAPGAYGADSQAEALSAAGSHGDLLNWRLDGADWRSYGPQRDTKAVEPGRNRPERRDVQRAGVQ